MKTYELFRAEINVYVDKDLTTPVWRSDCWPTKEQALKDLAKEVDEIAEAHVGFTSEEWADWIRSGFKAEMLDGDQNLYDGGFAEITCHIPDDDALLCDKCTQPIDKDSNWGNCPNCEFCLCEECAKSWTELSDDTEPGYAVCEDCLFIWARDGLKVTENKEHVVALARAGLRSHEGKHECGDLQCSGGVMCSQCGRDNRDGTKTCTHCKRTLCPDCYLAWVEAEDHSFSVCEDCAELLIKRGLSCHAT